MRRIFLTIAVAVSATALAAPPAGAERISTFSVDELFAFDVKSNEGCPQYVVQVGASVTDVVTANPIPGFEWWWPGEDATQRFVTVEWRLCDGSGYLIGYLYQTSPLDSFSVTPTFNGSSLHTTGVIELQQPDLSVPPSLWPVTTVPFDLQIASFDRTTDIERVTRGPGVYEIADALTVQETSQHTSVFGTAAVSGFVGDLEFVTPDAAAEARHHHYVAYEVQRTLPNQTE